VGGGVVLGSAVGVDDEGEPGFNPEAQGGPIFKEDFKTERFLRLNLEGGVSLANMAASVEDYHELRLIVWDAIFNCRRVVCQLAGKRFIMFHQMEYASRHFFHAPSSCDQ
jgi:hypothetical protein